MQTEGFLFIKMKILVFEVDIHSYHSVRNTLEEYDEQWEVIGPFTTVGQARDYLMQHNDIDIIITDTVLGGGLSFAALDHAPNHVPIIFITSHEEYALKAFDYLSLSYLRKPVQEDELIKALAKAVRLSKASSLLTPTGGWTKRSNSMSRIMAKTLHGERIVHTSTVRYIVSEQKNTYLKLLDGNSYRIDKTLEQMEQMLSEEFMRVNRKYIIPLEQVEGTEHIENGKLLILLKGIDAPTIVVSRTRKVEVCKWLNPS